MNSGRRGENRLWKRVTPTVTEFAWLPPNLAESFCKNALYRDDVRTYCAFDTPHLGLDTKNFVADVFVENILYLGDTRSADDLSVFTKMFFFFSSLAERAITAVPVTALPLEAIVTSSAMPRFHQAESNNKRKQNKQQPSKTNNATPTRHKPKTKHLSGN